MRRVLVAAGLPPLSPELAARGYSRVNPEAWSETVEGPKVKSGCLMAGLAIVGISTSIVGGALYLAYHIARAVWS